MHSRKRLRGSESWLRIADATRGVFESAWNGSLMGTVLVEYFDDYVSRYRAVSHFYRSPRSFACRRLCETRLLEFRELLYEPLLIEVTRSYYITHPAGLIYRHIRACLKPLLRQHHEPLRDWPLCAACVSSHYALCPCSSDGNNSPNSTFASLTRPSPPDAAWSRLAEREPGRACSLRRRWLSCSAFAHGPRGRQLFSKPNRPTLSAALEQWLAASREDSPQIT